MPRRVVLSVALVGWAVGTVLPAVASAQIQTGIISGVVRDPSGAVLPGVTVEASSPALIEKVRSAVTDGEGVYRVINLTPGVYTVTFTLPGFSTAVREGLNLSAGVTLPINADMRVGAIEETITVSGQTPLVDVQNTTQHRVVTRDVFETLPTGGYWWNQATILPGVSSSIQDVGGLSSRGVKAVLAIHGSMSSDMPMLFDGMRYNAVWGTGGGSGGTYTVNSGTIQELAMDTSGATAEAESSGVRVNVIPRQGGNRFSGANTVSYANDALQGTNVNDKLRARGADTSAVTKHNWDVNPALGGPIKQDRAWFFFSYQTAGVQSIPPGVFYNVDPLSITYTPDLNREQPRSLVRYHSFAGRATVQTSSKSKLGIYADHTPQYRENLSATTSWESITPQLTPRNELYQATWAWTLSHRILIDVGQSWHPEHFVIVNRPEVPTDRTGINDAGLGITYRAPTSGTEQKSQNYSGRAAVSFVTGSHNLKFGGDWFWGDRVYTIYAPTDMFYNFTNGGPTGLTLRTTPSPAEDAVKMNLGVFVQEQWTRKRLTLNMGLRFDYLNAYTPEQNVPAARFVGPRNFPRFENQPNWRDISPRFGMAFDLFGNGRTAVKASVNRYMELQAVGITELVNPMLATGGTTTTRSWNDANRNFVPDCDLTDPVLNNECGPTTNTNFGKAIVTTRYAPGITEGWGNRGYNWELSGGVQHQLLEGLSVEASYHRRSFGNLRVLDNLDVTPADYDPYCVTTPADPRLPGGGRQSLCGFYDIKPAKLGLNTNEWILADDLGARQVFNGVDFNVNARLVGGIVLQGGVSTGRLDGSVQPGTALAVAAGTQPLQPTCFVVDSPQVTELCNEDPPFQTQVKGSAVVPLPWWGIETSFAYQSIPGIEVRAQWAVPTAAITPSLGRDLAGGALTAAVQLITPNTVFEDRLHQLDLRVGRAFRIARTTIRPQFSVFNVFNSATVLAINTAYGANWLRPTNILAPRIATVGAQVNW
jgi:carboxypeptidase family protein